MAVVGAAEAAEQRVLRSREVVARPQALRNTMKPGDLMPLHLFADSRYEAVLESRSDDRLNGLVWRGRLADHADSWVVMVEHDGVMAGVIATGERLYRIRYSGDGRHLIEEMNPRSLRQRGNDTVESDMDFDAGIEAHGLETELADQASSSGPTEIDVLMVYTNKAARKLVRNRDQYFWIEETNARKAIESQARLSIAVANAALENSRIKAVFRLVGVSKIAGRGTRNSSRDLARLADPGDGRFDKAHILRERFGADFVVMLVGKMESGVGGRGYIIPAAHPSAPDSAFSIVRSTALWWTAVAHELGHNMGLVHDPDHDTVPPVWRSHRYARGYRDEAKGLATLMAYEEGCDACWLTIPHYSSPKVRWRGRSQPSDPDLLHVQPTCFGDESPGAPPHVQFPVCGTKTGSNRFNAAKSIQKNRSIFAAFRPCQVDCTQSE